MFITKATNGDRKFSGRSKARVIDNRDPLLRGRIRVNHPQLGETVWIDYLRSPNIYDPPEIGDIVFIECESGASGSPIARGRFIKTNSDNSNSLPTQFQKNIPTVRGQYTPGGHSIELDDGDAANENGNVYADVGPPTNTTTNRGVRITTTGGQKIHVAEDPNGDQHILLEDNKGNLIKIDFSDNTVNIKALDKINTEAGGDQNETIGGKLTINVSGDANITSGGAVNVTSSAKTIVTASIVELNGASGKVLTHETDPVVDTIFGTPHIGSSIVKAGP